MKAVIEIPMGSEHKYEIDKVTGQLVLDRSLNQPIPANYGYIVDTLAKDGDALDVFVVTNKPLLPGSVCSIYVINVMYCKDNGVDDNKIVATLEDDIVTPDFRAIETYLRTYKDLFEYSGMSQYSNAMSEILECQERFRG